MELIACYVTVPSAHVPGCTNDMFDCHGDGSKCIQYNLVCDGWNDCGNYEDERVDHKHCSSESSPCLNYVVDST